MVRSGYSSIKNRKPDMPRDSMAGHYGVVASRGLIETCPLSLVPCPLPPLKLYSRWITEIRDIQIYYISRSFITITIHPPFFRHILCKHHPADISFILELSAGIVFSKCFCLWGMVNVPLQFFPTHILPPVLTKREEAVISILPFSRLMCSVLLLSSPH